MTYWSVDGNVSSIPYMSVHNADELHQLADRQLRGGGGGY